MMMYEIAGAMERLEVARRHAIKMRRPMAAMAVTYGRAHLSGLNVNTAGLGPLDAADRAAISEALPLLTNLGIIPKERLLP